MTAALTPRSVNSGLCGVVSFFGSCPLPAVARVIMGCVHEHMRDGSMCAEHAAWAAEPEDSGGDCRACHEGPRSHPCPLTFIRVEPLTAVGG